MSNNDQSSIILKSVIDFTRVANLENYEGMLGTLTEDDPKVKTFISSETPKYTLEMYRLDVDVGPKNLKITDQGRRPTVLITNENGEKVPLPVPEKSTPPINWSYKKIAERLLYDLGPIMMCDVVRVGRLPFNHFFPVMHDGNLDLTVSREHGLVLYYHGGLHYVDYGSLMEDNSELRKEGSTNGTYLENGEKIRNCLHAWNESEPLEIGQSVVVMKNHKEVKKRLFKLVYKKFVPEKKSSNKKEAVESV